MRKLISLCAGSACAAMLVLSACTPDRDAPEGVGADGSVAPDEAAAPDEDHGDAGSGDTGDGDAETHVALDPREVAQGEAIARQECAGCHGLPGQGASPNANAPPLEELLARYDQDVLAGDLIEGIQLGHDQMPLFDFNVIAADALVAYLRSIRPAPDASYE